MSALTQYVELAKTEEVADQLRRQGYQVEIEGTRHQYPFDLVATKGEERLAVEVKVLSELRGHAPELQALRRRALREGFTEFRLVVASPPHEKDVTVEHLDGALYEYLVDHIPSSVSALASETRIESVSYLDIDGIRVTLEGTEVEGSGVVAVTQGYGGSRDGVETSDSFPFRFRVLLDRDVHLKQVYQLDVDVSSLSEE
ncbi:MAG: hypothetical protein ACR2JY_02225 [Chloroflexota bacterium]